MTTQETVVHTSGDSATPEVEATHHFMQLQSELLAYYRVKATSRFVELARPRMRAHLLEAGKGEPVVMLHGGDGEAVNWAPLMGPLQKQVRVFAVDRPGFGLSDAFDYRTADLRTHAADFVASMLAALGLESATLIGGSMGGFFALAATLAHPELIRKLVLVGYPAGATKDISEGMRVLCGTPGMPEQFMKGRDTMEAQRSQYRDMFHVDPATVPDLYFETRIAGLRLPSEQGTWATLLPRIASLEGLRPEMYLGDELPRLKTPTLMIWGEHDMAPAEVGRGIAGKIPGARFEYLPGIGHFPFLEAPELCARLIAEFLGVQPAREEGDA
jgi:pimeloyl-ACP methyl ester carboxylesterase